MTDTDCKPAACPICGAQPYWKDGKYVQRWAYDHTPACCEKMVLAVMREINQPTRRRKKMTDADRARKYIRPALERSGITKAAAMYLGYVRRIQEQKHFTRKHFTFRRWKRERERAGLGVPND